MSDTEIETAWRTTYAARFNSRAIQRPQASPLYVRPTDEQIAALPEQMRGMAYLVRSLRDAADVFTANMVGVVNGQPAPAFPKPVVERNTQ